MLTLALGIGATTSIFTLVHAVLLKSLPVTNPGELYRLGKESRCCYQGGYSQEKEFSRVSYDLYKCLRDNTKGFSELAAFPASRHLIGVRRAGSSEAAQAIQTSLSQAITLRCSASEPMPVVCLRLKMIMPALRQRR